MTAFFADSIERGLNTLQKRMTHINTNAHNRYEKVYLVEDMWTIRKLVISKFFVSLFIICVIPQSVYSTQE